MEETTKARRTRRTPRDAHARADPASAHELAKDTTPSERARSGRAPRLQPDRYAPHWTWSLPSVGRHARTRAFSDRDCALGADTTSFDARAPTRARAGSRSRASSRAPRARGDRFAANPRPRRGPGGAIRACDFPAVFPRAFLRARRSTTRP
jgi:hypothetical protein